MKGTFILRFAVAIILIAHSISGMFNNGVNDFGNLYLNIVGFSPIGLLLAWLIKISHLVAAVLLLINKFIKPAAIITIFILIMGIIMIHFQEGWFVVGGGRNGMEFNFLLIFVLVAIMFPNGINFNKSNQ
ncbi:putative oxidoreductase [Flavobacterium swingsii]|uniref:Putative oxidoreductase n=1 Tax=Flavobacterium swingsii TaxID=498292 RepID=A0A1I0W920_9FLAO|nr:DoxX family protein [Flavobacterium swingsii]SFA84406.1 putative oxidoreductase [Flavobacterium swingsii]